ncbi:MAG: hypothetical protein ACM3VX_00565 [Bacteroidota bacterium]
MKAESTLIRGNRRVALVLTATIDPGGMRFVSRRTPEVRFMDYVRSLRKWVRTASLFQSILWIENSGHRLAEAIKNEFGNVVQVVSFAGNNYSRDLGKGYGEALILEKAGSVLRSVGDAEYVLKCTGRLYYKNANDLVAVLRQGPDMVVRLSRDLAFADSRVFAIRLNLLETLMEGFKTEVNDCAGTFFEHVLARHVLSLAARGYRVHPFPSPPLLEGWSGSSGERIRAGLLDPRNMLRRVAYGVAGRLKYI